MTNNLTRVTAKIFASNAPLDTIGQFGSALDGTKVNTQDVAQLQALPAYENGWNSAVISDRNYPTLEEMNGVLNVMSYQTAYSMQKGICEWDANTTYFASTSFCQVNGIWYQSLIDNNIGNNPTDSPGAWEELPLTNFANKNLSNLTQEGEKHFLNKSQITNCILESPKMVDLELNDGTLTMKAGSKVIVPYGKAAPTMAIDDALNGGTIVDISWNEAKEELFYIVQYNEDISEKWTDTDTLSPSIVLTSSGPKIGYCQKGKNASGTEAISNALSSYYNTNENIVYYKDNNVTISYVSLPFCVVKMTSGVGFTSIDETFQHFGYIGSNIWAMKGIKFLTPDGRNEDSTLNNLELTTKYVVTQARRDGSAFAVLNATGIYTFIWTIPYYIQEEKPTEFLSGFAFWYKPSTNKQYYSEGNSIFKESHFGIFCDFSVANEKIVRIKNINNAFQAVDYNAMRSGEIPTIVETYVNGTSWYRVYSDGWCEQGGFFSAFVGDVALFKNYIDTNYSVFTTMNATSGAANKCKASVVLSKTVSSFNLGNFDINGVSVNGVFWETKGYAA